MIKAQLSLWFIWTAFNLVISAFHEDQLMIFVSWSLAGVMISGLLYFIMVSK